MKVLHFLDTLNRGGAETQALDICQNAADFGLEMTLVTAQSGSMETDFRLTRVEFIKLGRKLPLDLHLAWQLRRIIKDRGIQIVHGYQAVDGLHLYLATIGMKNIRLVLSFQGGVSLDWKNLKAIKFLISRTHANIVVSRALEKVHEEIDGLVPENFTLIHNGADVRRLQPTGKSLRRELALPDDALLIGMIGNFYREARKDQLTVCKALPRVFAEIPNVHCIFAGKVEDEAYETSCREFCVENKIIEKVHFLGGRTDVPDILAALDIFVFSSLREGLPVAMAEAMLAKVPLIVSDIDPLLEMSDGGKYAEVFPIQNAEVLSESLLKLLKSEDLRERLAMRAFRHAEEHFSIRSHLELLRELYTGLLRDQTSSDSTSIPSEV